MTPSLPSFNRGERIARPTETASAPSAKSLYASYPDSMPQSAKIFMLLPASASLIFGRALAGGMPNGMRP